MSQPPPLQFDQAEYKEGAGTASQCVACTRPLVDNYFAVNGKIVCPSCKEKLSQFFTGGSGVTRFFGALGMGSVAAGVASAAWYAVTEATGMNFGLLAVVVGWLVGWAVRRGSEGRGGAVYQLMAVFLTYTAIVCTYVPAIMQELSSAAAANADGTQAPNDDTGAAAPPADTVQQPPESRPEDSSLVTIIYFLLALGFAFAAPFLGGVSNILGMIIIAIGLYEAWKMNRKPVIEISGPFKVAPQEAVGAA